MQQEFYNLTGKVKRFLHKSYVPDRCPDRFLSFNGYFLLPAVPRVQIGVAQNLVIRRPAKKNQPEFPDSILRLACVYLHLVAVRDI
jgi:hypothetical protein